MWLICYREGCLLDRGLLSKGTLFKKLLTCTDPAVVEAYYLSGEGGWGIQVGALRGCLFDLWTWGWALICGRAFVTV